MQLYALDKDKRVVFANHAKKHIDYTCPECASLIRLRGGIHRQNHFYHLDSNRKCRQNGKSMEHLQTQFRILETFTEAECSLEVHFPEIKRIADCVFHKHKIIFEIQCSPISALEVKQRNADYRKLGYEVIWILHEKRFNLLRPSLAEQHLAPYVHYFTNIDALGCGIFYDQFQMIEGGTRKPLSKKKPLTLDKALHREEAAKVKTKVPLFVKQKIHNSAYYFEGDLTDSCLKGEDEELIETLFQIEKAHHFSQKKGIIAKFTRLIHNYIVRPYDIVFKMYLERACM